MKVSTTIEEMNDLLNKAALLVALIAENCFETKEGVDIRETDEFTQLQDLIIKIGMRDTGITDIQREIARKKLLEQGRVIK